MTPSLRTWRHPLRDLKVREPMPHTRVVHAEHCEVLRPDLVHIALVCDGESAPLKIVESRRVHRSAREAPVARRAGIIALGDVSVALRRCPVRRKALVTRELRCRGLASREFEDVSWVGRVTEMAMKPPLLEGVPLEGRNRAIVIREGLLGDIETVHAGMPDRCNWSAFRDRRVVADRTMLTLMAIRPRDGKGREYE